MYVDSAIEEHVSGLADELGELLADNLTKNPSEAQAGMARAAFIRAEIEAHGFYVTWSAEVDVQTFAVDVEVLLLKPREGLTGADREMYEAWHAKAKARFEEMKRSGQ